MPNLFPIVHFFISTQEPQGANKNKTFCGHGNRIGVKIEVILVTLFIPMMLKFL